MVLDRYLHKFKMLFSRSYRWEFNRAYVRRRKVVRAKRKMGRSKRKIAWFFGELAKYVNQQESLGNKLPGKYSSDSERYRALWNHHRSTK